MQPPLPASQVIESALILKGEAFCLQRLSSENGRMHAQQFGSLNSGKTGPCMRTAYMKFTGPSTAYHATVFPIFRVLNCCDGSYKFIVSSINPTIILDNVI